jgi:hypothetical protein
MLTILKFPQSTPNPSLENCYFSFGKMTKAHSGSSSVIVATRVQRAVATATTTSPATFIAPSAYIEVTQKLPSVTEELRVLYEFLIRALFFVGFRLDVL